MSINFQGNLTFDKSFYTLKHSNCAEISEVLNKFYEVPQFRAITPDTVILGHGGKTRDSLTIRFVDAWDIPIVPKKEVTLARVLHQLLLNTCFYNNEQPLSASYESVKKSLFKILKRNLDAK